MILAASDFMPAWMIWTSMVFALGAAGLFVYGTVRYRVKPMLAPPSVVAPDSVEAPPMPNVSVASQPLPVHDPNAKRRAGFRRVGNPIEVLVCDKEFKESPRRGWVVDRSRHGLRLSLYEKYAAGTILQVRPSAAADSTPWLEVEVRNAQPGDQSTFELGCKFTYEPAWELLLQFG